MQRRFVQVIEVCIIRAGAVENSSVTLCVVCLCWYCCTSEISCWMYTGERQAGRIRAKYVRAILRQNVGYFDTESSNTAAVVSSVSADTMLLQDAISEKVSASYNSFRC